MKVENRIRLDMYLEANRVTSDGSGSGVMGQVCSTILEQNSSFAVYCKLNSNHVAITKLCLYLIAIAFINY